MDEQFKNSEERTELQKAIAEEIMKGEKRKRNLIILSSVAIVVIIAVVIAILVKQPSHFERVKKEAIQIAGQVSYRGEDNFTIDTYPYEDLNMSAEVIAMLAPSARRKALEAIEYVNEELGFNDALYDRMIGTSAIMGRQSEENDKYRVFWTYHPNRGLEVTYEKK